MAGHKSTSVLLGAGEASGVLAALFEQSKVGLALIDRELRYVVVNDALAAMNRLSADEHVGLSVRAPLVPLLARVLLGETISDVEIPDRRFRASYVPVTVAGEVVSALAIVVDVTGGRRADHALRITQQRLELAMEGTRTGSYEWDIATNVIRWSANLGELWGRERGWSPADYEQYLLTLHPDDRGPLSARVQEALETGAPYEIDFRMLRPDGAIRWMHTRGHVVRDDGDEAPVALVGLVEDVHEHRMAQRADEYLAKASLALAASGDPEQTLHQVAQFAIGELADWCWVHVVDPDGGMRLVVAAHLDPEMVSYRHELEERYPPDPEAAIGAAEAIRSRRPQLLEEITDAMLRAGTRDAEHLRIARALELRSAMVVPMVAAGEVLGAISFYYAGPDRRYTEQTLELAEELGRRAGLALANARSHSAERLADERLRQLQSVTDAALSQLALDELLPEMLSRVRDVLSADFAVCLLLDPDEGVLTVRAELGIEGEGRKGLRIALGDGIAGKIAQQSGPMIIDDVPAAHPVSPELRTMARSLLGVPLRVDGRTVGVLHVSNRAHRSFGAEDAELLTLVADRVARAVERASAFDHARHTAMTLQRSLLPDIVSSIAGLQMATRYLPGQAGSEVGGDWYDIVELPDGRQAVCVGDVAGRGVTAAAVMGRLRSSLRAYLHIAPGPVQAIELLDDLVAGDPDVTFATILVAAIDARTGDVELCSAGHPPAVLAGDEVRLLDFPVGPPIGIEDVVRTAATAQLAPGDALLLYTDGLVERRRTAIDERIAQLCQAVACAPRDPELLLDRVVAEMLGDQTSVDDVALVGAWRRES
jgi:phosphoserine phosphatase RsbU/P